ncbi:MAG TPA: sugar phosphate nucleotidyltransferase [Pyrinomonadaceae bacterium]|jgi:mannose-1-phosphate guanylyltransferase/mannose-6-phosphate isomerase
MIALFMAGGSGTRLWPLSRENNPKQVQSLVSNKSLMTQTIERVLPLIESENIWIVTSENCKNQIAAHAPGVPEGQIIAEPFPLGTNLAVGLGAVHIARRDPEAVIVVGWADSYIGNESEFLTALERAHRLAPEVDGVILAVQPDAPRTEYGYIEIGEPISGHDGAFRIAAFEEKPDAVKARHFIETGFHFWNPGISVWKVSRLLALMEKYKPDHFAALERVAEALGTAEEATVIEQSFAHLDRTAIDHAIFEKAPNMATIPVDLNWSDIGSWSALYDVRRNGESNVTRGTVVSLDTDKCLILAKDRLIATLGVTDLIIVETDDAILIAHKNDSQRLKELHSLVRDRTGARYL